MENTGIDFINTVRDDENVNSFLFRNFYNGGGVALGDINNDGWVDVLLTANMLPDKLYLNKGNFQFEDISQTAGIALDSAWSTGAVMVDINADGWLDIYICESGPPADTSRRNKLYINNGQSGFTEQAAKYGLDYSGYCTQASFFDYDGDGDLDCLLISNSPLPFSSLNYASLRDAESDGLLAAQYKGGGNHLFKNENGYYREVTREAGLHTGLISFGLGVYTGDLNNDGLPDIYVGNDFIERDYLYINQGDGSFRDELEDRVSQISMSSMSTDVGDINNDGHPEIFTTDMIPDDDYRLKTTGTFDNFELYQSKLKAGLYHQFVKNSLQLNQGNGHFSEIANYSGVYGTDWSWGALFLDADNDGYNDIFICNGINRDLGDLDFLEYFSGPLFQQMQANGRAGQIDEILQHIPIQPLANRVFRNNGQLQFQDVTESWGFAEPGFSNSVAYADLDNDGDLDLVINNENQPASIFRNQSSERKENHFISLQLFDTVSTNRNAIGAKINMYVGPEILYRELNPVRGFQSSVDYTQVIGIGQRTAIDSIHIIWPDQSTTILLKTAIDQKHSIYKTGNEPHLEVSQNLTQGYPLFKQKDHPFLPHVENEYWDYYAERNIPSLLSREGPAFAVADVNGDGLEDLFVGGAQGQSAVLYLQTASGFVANQQAAFSDYADFEDVAAVFLDADGDGDLDLYVGAGGNNIQPGSRQLQHRLYKNDGKGNFSIAIASFPSNDVNISSAVAHDWDGDGDVDLFIAARSVPYQYGRIPVSQLLLNDGKGTFENAPKQVFPSLHELGMLTDAAIVDLNADGKMELVLAGEWMPPRIFTCSRDPFQFREWTHTGLETYYGWWQKITIADMDADGKPDLVIGNAGENFYLQPDADNPVKLFINDFDGDGSLESFLTKTVKGVDKPVFLKKDMTEQFPALKKENLQHSDFASKSLEQLFPKSLYEKSRVMQFNYPLSIVAYNNGSSGFNVSPLPAAAQLSVVCAILAKDINGDGIPDLLLGGNQFGFPPQFGKQDGLSGLVLLGKEKKKFETLNARMSGIWISGETRAFYWQNQGESIKLIAIRNNNSPLLFESIN